MSESLDALDSDELRVQLRQALSDLESKEKDLIVAAEYGSKLCKVNASLTLQLSSMTPSPSTDNLTDESPNHTLKKQTSIAQFHHTTNLEQKNAELLDQISHMQHQRTNTSHSDILALQLANSNLQDQLVDSLKDKKQLITLHNKQLSRLNNELNASKSDVLLAIEAAHKTSSEKNRIVHMHKKNQGHSNNIDNDTALKRLLEIETEFVDVKHDNEVLVAKAKMLEEVVEKSKEKIEELESVIEKTKGL